MKIATFGRLAVTALLIAAPLGVAYAADMPVKAAKAPPPPPFDWNGFYIGGYAGAAWMDQVRTSDPCAPGFGPCVLGITGNYNGFPPSSYDMSSSFIGGATVGWNWQPTQWTLIGFENIAGYIHLKGSIVANPPPLGVGDTVMTTKVGNWYDAYTVRLGAVADHAMFYVKGGGVSARFSTGVVDNVPPTTLNTTTSKTITGWAAGGGVEYGIDNHWSVKAEYLVLGLPQNQTNCGPQFIGAIGPIATCSVTHVPNVQTVTLGLNYRFH
jgi:outer membrane immunogenic protein